MNYDEKKSCIQINCFGCHNGEGDDSSVQSLEYSIDEKAVGHWIDGKTIYKRTLDLGNLTSYGLVYIDNATSAVRIPVDLNKFGISLKTLVKKEILAFGLDTDGATTINNSIYFTSSSDNSACLESWLDNPSGTFNIYVGKQYQRKAAQNSKYYLTLFYTKNS